MNASISSASPTGFPCRDAIHVSGLRLWAHVGVLERERELGQWFELEFSLWHNLEAAGRSDDLSCSLDYGLAIQALQHLAVGLRCHTIERFAERVMDELERLYGAVPQRVLLTKCQAPVAGFHGRVAVERWRHAGGER
ncbi:MULTISPECIES: dihydroneopterin aldolase [Synechococcales]|uniref:dihydroneopterin aldolase n=1 Tax=Synechococcus sp. CS-1324 TaxID=2847980 RepID=UPI00223AED0E|nr:dihydroneopterin aldolase [Synechococcus sp. CS-1324]